VTGSMSGQDLALILGTIIGGLSALAAFTATIFKIAKGVAAINAAVNHQAPGEPPLVERVKAMVERVDAIEAAQKDHNGAYETHADRQLLAEATARVRHEENQAAIDALRKDVRSLGARMTRHEHEAKPPTRPRKGTS